MHQTQLFSVLDKLLVVDAVCVFSGCFASSLMHEAGCLIKTWQLHTIVYMCVCLLTAPDCCETHRANSLFPFQSEAQPTSIITDRERGRKESDAGGRSDRWRNDLNSEGIFSVCVFKAWIHTRYIRKRNAEASAAAFWDGLLVLPIRNRPDHTLLWPPPPQTTPEPHTGVRAQGV